MEDLLKEVQVTEEAEEECSFSSQKKNTRKGVFLMSFA